MTTPDKPRPWQDALGEIYRRATIEPSFRSLCMSDVAAAFKAVGDFEVPDDVKLRFIEKPHEIIFVLPPLAADCGLSEAELDLVAGGAPVVSGPVGPYYPYVYPYGWGTYGWGFPPGPDPATPTGYPPLVKPGGPPPGY